MAVDAGEEEELALEQGIDSLPTLQLWLGGACVETLKGGAAASPERVQEALRAHAARAEGREPLQAGAGRTAHAPAAAAPSAASDGGAVEDAVAPAPASDRLELLQRALDAGALNVAAVGHAAAWCVHLRSCFTARPRLTRPAGREVPPPAVVSAQELAQDLQRRMLDLFGQFLNSDGVPAAGVHAWARG